MADLAITAAQVQLTSGNTGVLTAGEAITAGQVLYKKAADGKAWKAITSSAAAAEVIGIALCDCAAEQKVVYALNGAVVQFGAGAAMAAGSQYAASDTAGGLQPDADIAAAEFTTQVVVGVGSTSGKLNILATGVAHA